MTALEKIELLLNRALERVNSERLRSIAEALVLLLPETLAAIQSVAVDSASSPAQKLRASEMLLTVHQRVVTADLEFGRSDALRMKSKARIEAARAERARIALESKKSDLEIARTRRKYSRILSKAAKATKTGEKQDERV